MILHLIFPRDKADKKPEGVRWRPCSHGVRLLETQMLWPGLLFCLQAATILDQSKSSFLKEFSKVDFLKTMLHRRRVNREGASFLNDDII